MTEMFSELDEAKETFDFKPTRTNGLIRLKQFVGRTGRHYASARNYDFGTERRSNVSGLSPWLRHRFITEKEVLATVLASHNFDAAEKFVQEVFWRTYFKGWLEQRPSVWSLYKRDLLSACERLRDDEGLEARFNDAVNGNTGIDCFDHWARELVATGYLHNHARMWFASIWIFTLRLPWQLGADFFLRHLLDGDPASNTLSWRWVGGLHTKGKTYLARPDNIAKYTEGRFQPKGLAKFAEPLTEPVDHPLVPLSSPHMPSDSPYLLLLTEDDLSAHQLMPTSPVAKIGLLATHGRSPNPLGDVVQDFAKGAMSNALEPHGKLGQSTEDWCGALIEAARNAGVATIATAYAPVGPTQSRLDRAEPVLRDAGLSLNRIMRPYDAITWPHAKAGFFGLRKKIPSLLRQLNLATQQRP
ncbi:FAD-binding domain-containing protein [Ruegeria sp. HKCCD6604]|uniref:FAD-binding domain-containing protein n=1 Tax=Ruegeria sp. HKCCD6604 TaxID=2683000 RepID=UPI001492EDB5|nr:FAD-binding domain-containing protein [Ruegeria sp. HKCCD6604]NOC94267.1 DNA photolyase [Ruegeria sp. HKCCD6604]